MDIVFIPLENGILIKPNSCLGMLWLQTHFENEEWDQLAEDRVRLSSRDSEVLYEDAIKAGLTLKYLTSNALSKKI